MKPFTTCTSKALCLMDDNIDTDAIFPARYLLLLDREGMGQYLFHDRRYNADGAPNPDFILNNRDFKGAQIIVAGDGFGCGSSREQAVWALDGFGIRCVIAPSFGDIFRGNCMRNGILTIQLPRDTVEKIALGAAQAKSIEVDLPGRRVSQDDEFITEFHIEADDAEALLNGWDETQRILANEAPAISAFESRHKQTQPWLFS